jgi:Icc-related predicted phosphoesterase
MFAGAQGRYCLRCVKENRRANVDSIDRRIGDRVCEIHPNVFGESVSLRFIASDYTVQMTSRFGQDCGNHAFYGDVANAGDEPVDHELPSYFMRLLIFSDIHGDAAALERLMGTDADYYFAAGDLANWGKGLDQLGPILQKRAERMYVMPGNHESENDIERFCERYGFHNFHGQSITVDGYAIAGLGYSNPTPFNTPGEYSEEELAEKLAPFASLDPLVLICHCPPQGTKLDRAGAGQHFGSRSVREFIERKQPEHFFCGHIHEAAGVSDQLGKTQGMNVGKRGFLLELEPLVK